MNRIAVFALVLPLAAVMVGCSSSRAPAPPSSMASTRPAPDASGDPALLAALELVEGGQYQEAATRLEILRASGGASAEVYSLLGLAYLQLRNYDRADSVLRDGRNRFPQDAAVGKSYARLLFVQGKERLEAGARAEARDLFLRATAEAPSAVAIREEIATLYRHRAYAMIQVGRAPDAIGILDDAAALGFRSDEATVLRAGALSEMGRRAEALRELYAVNPNNVRDADVVAVYQRLGGRVTTPVAPATAPGGDSLLRSAEDLLARGLPDEALSAVARGMPATREDPTKRAEYLEVAFRAAFAAKDYPAAHRFVEERRSLDPTDLEASLDLGRLLAVMGRPDEAREHYEQLQASFPGDARVRLAYSGYLVTSGEVDAARTHLLALAEAPGLESGMRARAFELLGICCTRMDDLDCAESWWLKKVELDPGDSKTYYNLGFLYQKKRRYRQAVENFERAVDASNEKDPNFVKYLYWLGLAYRQNGQARDMSRTLKKILVVAPYQDPYRQKVIPMMEREGEGLRRRPKDLPSDRSHPLTLAWERMETGDLRTAEEAFKQALDGTSGDSSLQRVAHHGLGLVARRRSDPARAVFHLERSLELGEADRVWLELAEASFDLGLYDRSLEAWRKLRRSKEVEPARRRYEEARCLDRLGRVEEAMEAYEEALSLDPESLFAGSAKVRLEELLPSFLAVAPPSAAAAPRADGLARVADVYREEGSADKAEALFARAVQAAPDSPEALVGLARIRLDQGDVAGAEEALRRAVDAAPSHAGAHLELARVALSDADRLQDGFAYLARARELGGEAGMQATLEMVRLYRQVGQAEDARFLLEELDRSPEASPEVRRQVRAELAREDALRAAPDPAASRPRGPGE